VTATLELSYEEPRETASDPGWLVELNRVDTVNQLRSLKQPGRITGEELSYQPVLSRIQSGSVRAHQNTRMRPESTLGRQRLAREHVERGEADPTVVERVEKRSLIDHGASLYFHHTGTDYIERSRSPFAPIKQHVLLSVASQIAEADALLKARLTREVIEEIINTIPETWLENDLLFADSETHRAAYITYLLDRLAASHIFVEEALYARAELL